MFDRFITLVGEENFRKVSSKKVLVIGTGGVGGYVIEGLVRSGIGQIDIVDGDKVDLSNLNRQIIALHSTLGLSKTEVLKERMLDINPEIKIETYSKVLKSVDIEDMDFEKYDYIVDAIDDVRVKTEIIKKALKCDVPFISATGTARKLHPEKLAITTLDKTSGDALARIMRRNLKECRLDKIKVLASTEIPIKTFENRLGSSAFVPSIGGLLIASHIINDILEREI